MQSNILSTHECQKISNVHTVSVTLNIKQSIEKKLFNIARELLKNMLSNDMENPQPYNLLGIIYEMEGDRQNASKFYRIAYYIDQTYKAASKNLERVSEYFYHGASNIEWGIEDKGVK